MSAAIGVLNRILRMLCRSLPMYLDSARPWSDNDDRSAWIVLARLIADQRTLARRVAQALLDEGAQPDPGPFPSAFAAMNDLSLAFVLERIVQRQRAEVEALAACVGELADAPRAREGGT